MVAAAAGWAAGAADAAATPAMAPPAARAATAAARPNFIAMDRDIRDMSSAPSLGGRAGPCLRV
jgi:hypothetical protein